MLGATIAVLLVLFVALSPTLLFGESLSAFALVLLGASLIVVGLLVRWRGVSNARMPGTIVVIIGAVLLALGVGLIALVLVGRGWSP